MRRWAVRQLGDEAQAEEALTGSDVHVAKGESTLLHPPTRMLMCCQSRGSRGHGDSSRKTNCWTLSAPQTMSSLLWALPEKDWVKELEDRVFMEEFLAAMDEESRVICHKWLRGDEWKEIAGDVGCSVQHAKDKLRNAIESTKKRLLGPGSTNP